MQENTLPAKRDIQGKPMVDQGRRQTKRLIMRVPMRVHKINEPRQREQGVESLNISIRGTYFAAEGAFQAGEKVEVRLKVPELVAPGQTTEWCFTGRVVHADRLGTYGKTGVAVHFLYYSAGDK
jgi:hypothetical protein